MHNRIIITKETIAKKEYLITALFEENRLAEVSCENSNSKPILGNIYVGKIKRILPKINSVFVELTKGQMSYLPLSDVKEPLMVKQSRAGVLTEEDEIVVQVEKEAVKTKDATVTTNLNFKGNFLILTTENKKLGISKKLDEPTRKRLKELLSPKKDESFGLIVRTNAKEHSDEQILAEFQVLFEQFESFMKKYKHRTCYSLLHQEPSSFIQNIRNHLSLPLEKVTTDLPEVYEELKETFGNGTILKEEQISFYEDSMISVSSLYGLKFKITEALDERVWLKSGAYLVIQPTEALTVIDVNTGKCVKGKQKDFFLTVNLEAAKEVARQLRLRNISGICMVDFINMDTKEAEAELTRCLRYELAKDTVQTSFIDFTRLGLAEITRKKVRKPLYEQIHA